MNKKEIVNIHKRPDGIFEIECFEKPLRTQIAELEQENEQLKKQLAEKDKEINKLKEPKKYVYNCLSFVSNSDATDVAKYIEDLHQTIAQNNEELDEYIKKIVKLKERMEEKDKEIKELKEKEYWTENALKLRDCLTRYRVCDEIRAFFDVNPNTVEWDYLNEILNQIEQGEQE